MGWMMMVVVVCVYAGVHLERDWASLERKRYNELEAQESDPKLNLCMVWSGTTTLPNSVVIWVNSLELQGMAFIVHHVNDTPGAGQ